MSEGLETYCGTDTPVIWENGHLSACFQDTVLWGIVYIYFLLAALYRVIVLLRTPYETTSEPLKYFWTFYVKTACHVVLIMGPIMLISASFFRTSLLPFQAAYFISAVSAWLISLFIINLEYSRRKLHNWVIMSFWTLAFLLSALKMQTLVVLVRYDEEYWYETLVFAVIIICTVTLSCLALFYNFIPGVKKDDYRKLSAEERYAETAALLKKTTKIKKKYSLNSETDTGDADFRQESPEEHANILSIITYYWLNPILNTGYRRVLEDPDLYALRRIDQAERNSQLFQKYWQAELQKPKPSLLRALVKCYGIRFGLAGILKLEIGRAHV